MASLAISAPATKVVFHPFESWHCNFQVQVTQSAADPSDSWQHITSRLYKESNEPTKSSVLALLKNAKDTIYIPGQCTSGVTTLWSFNKSQQISVMDLIAMLKTYLPTTFQGKIKIYACHSASDGPDGKYSFAKKFAQMMRANGYNSCQYFGYTAQVSAYATAQYRGSANMANSANQHRFAMDGSNASQRASSVRVQL